MKLTVVGCAPAWTRRAGRASSCYLVEQDETAVVFDLGQGAFAELARYVDPGAVSAVFISHLHADHCVDLVPLRHYLAYERGGGAPSLYGPAELRSRFDAFQHADFLDGFGGAPLEPGTVTVGSLAIEAGRVTHIPDSFAFRVAAADADGPGLVYSGDCAVADDLLPLIQPGDTLLCEAAFGDGPPGGGMHLTAVEAATAAATANAARLILTHILDQRLGRDLAATARRVYRRQVLVAEPGMNVTVD